jgi:hypothetical protein
MICSNCGDICCNGIDCYYKDKEVDLIPQEYEWICPFCDYLNHIIDMTYPEYCSCAECDREVKLMLKDMKLC